MHITLDLIYLLLVLLKRLVSLEELRNVGLVAYFEHGDSLNGHLGGCCVRLAISNVWICEKRFKEMIWS